MTLKKNVWMKRRILGLALVSSVALGCDLFDKDEGKKSTSCAGTCVGDGFLVKGDGKSVRVTFEGAEAGQEFVLLPFATGESNQVGSQGTTAALKVSNASSSGLMEWGLDQGSNFSDPWSARSSDGDQQVTWELRDHNLRTIYNRFRPGMDLDADPSLLRLIRFHDKHSRSLAEQKTLQVNRPLTLEETLRRAQPKLRLTSTNETDCPSDFVAVPETSDLSTQVDIGVEKNIVGSDWCVVIAESSTPVSEPSEEKIKASMDEIMRVYKKVMYKDDMAAAAANGFVFNPIVVIVDFSNEDVWPSKIQHSGVFLSDLSTTAKRPMIYMAADQSKGGGPSDPVVARKWFHSTLAHEIHHAVVDWYRARGSIVRPETMAVDEGMAHFIQDLFGYGEVGFDGIAKPFLFSLIEGDISFLSGGAKDEFVFRGGAQSLIHYLVSQKGGVEFSGGKVSGGTGLAALAAMVKDTSANGAPALRSAFSSDWTASIGGFLGALILDGTSISGVKPLFSNQAIVEGLTDLEGTTEKSFGMRFNGFASMPDRLSRYVATTSAAVSSGEKSLDIYQTLPLRHVIKEGASSLTVELELEANAVQVVRTK